MLNRLCLLLILTCIAPLRAQDDNGVIQMTPDFCFSVPLTQKGADVTVKFPILVNPTTIITPGMVLRTIYLLNYGNADGSTDLVIAHHANMEQAYSREAANTDGSAKIPTALAHEIEGYRRTVWQVPNNFVQAMAQYPTDSMHLIFSITGKDVIKDLDDERFSFFDGLFIGLPDGKVTVLAVEKESKSDQAGIKAGDEILSVGGMSTKNDLAAFATAYAAARAKAREDETPTYSMTVRSDGKDTRTVNIAIPQTLKGSLLHGL